MKRHNAKKNAKRTDNRKRRKLELRRETVRNLSSRELADVAGGGFYYYGGFALRDGGNDTGFSADSCQLTNC